MLIIAERIMQMKSFLIKINGDYYAGMQEFDNSPSLIVVTIHKEKAKICEGFVNLKSHWDRIYTAMKNDTGIEVTKIEIEVCKMNDLKFRLGVHKMKCSECACIFLVEKSKHWSEDLCCCPICGGVDELGHMGDITIVEETDK